MPGLLKDVDPDGLLEYSVVYTDRAVNHMSAAFQSVMNDIADMLKVVYHAEAAVIVPGGGTYGMEAVARQLATGKRCLVIRNGFFSFRWSQIFEKGAIPAETTVLKARRVADEPKAPFAPAPIEEVVATIEAEKPDVVFAPHVETSAGMRNAQLIAAGLQQSYGGWNRLEKALSASLRDIRGARNPYGFSLAFFALIMIATVTFWMVNDEDTVAQLFEMLRF